MDRLQVPDESIINSNEESNRMIRYQDDQLATEHPKKAENQGMGMTMADQRSGQHPLYFSSPETALNQ